MINIQTLDHLVLRANDADKLIEFYCNILGCQIERQKPEIGLTQLRAGNILIDIVAVASKLGRQGGAGPAAEGANMDHFCLLIDDIAPQALIAYLDQHQIRHSDFAERYGSLGHSDSIYIFDPENNSIELKPNKPLI